VLIVDSQLGYNYKTIKVTQSRINKGLLAIPVSLIDYFPKKKGNVYVSFNNSNKLVCKTFTPYKSSSRECRIGGLREFFEDNFVKDDDELVIQILDVNKFRILTESKFEKIIKKIEREFDNTGKEVVLNNKLKYLTEITNTDLDEVIKCEFFRISNSEVHKRKYKMKNVTKSKEAVSPAIKKILTKVYEGKCQLTGFTFLMKNGQPFFEIHHIDPFAGNHVKNLLVVSPNIHAQFTFAILEQQFDKNGWLRKVWFNADEYVVNQFIDKIPGKFKKEIHYNA